MKNEQNGKRVGIFLLNLVGNRFCLLSTDTYAILQV